MNKDVMGVQEVSPGYEFVAENPAVPVGYKQTEVGVIPDEWRVQQVQDFSDVGRGRVISHRAISTAITPLYPVYSSQTTNNGVMGYLDTFDFEGQYVTWTTDGANAGTVFYRDGRFNCTNVCGTIRTLTEDPQFIARILSKFAPRHVSRHLGNPKLMNDVMKRATVPLPPLQEQRAIATALSDVDALLEELDRLIAKKRDIKQAAMQQLLTGETRLPGFDGEWESFRLGDHVTFLKTGTNSRAELQSDGNDASVRYLHYGDIHASKASFMDSSALPFLPSEKAATLGRLQNGDLIMSDASEDIEGIGKSVEITNVGTADVVAGLHTIAARFSPDVLADGFKAYLQYCPAFITPLRRLAAGTKVYATTRKHVESIEMQLPGLEEQVAIAHVFKDMDTEIQALEQRRSKTAELKQGMMQELLTGRTRLV